MRNDLEARLSSIEMQLAALSPDSVTDKPVPSVSESSYAPQAAAAPAAAPVEASPFVSSRRKATRDVTVSVRPLVELSLARAVESTLADTEGVESAKLTSISGDSAVVHAVVGQGISVVASLRQNLPVAFDVIESSDHAISIELAEAREPGEPATDMETES